VPFGAGHLRRGGAWRALGSPTETTPNATRTTPIAAYQTGVESAATPPWAGDPPDHRLAFLAGFPETPRVLGHDHLAARPPATIAVLLTLSRNGHAPSVTRAGPASRRRGLALKGLTLKLLFGQLESRL